MMTATTGLSKLALGTAGVFALAMGSAQAVTVPSQFFPGELNQLSDNNAEYLNIDSNANGFLDVGDSVRGITAIETVEDLTGGGGSNLFGANGVDEFTGIFEGEVLSRTLVSDQDDLDPSNDLYNFTFGPRAGFGTEWEDNLGLAAGTLDDAVMLLFGDSTIDYDRTTTIANGEASATGGDLLLAYGLTGADLDEVFTIQSAQQDVDLSDVAAGTSVGTFQLQTSLILNNTGFGFEQVLAGVEGPGPGDSVVGCNAAGGPVAGNDCFVDFNASGSAVGTGGANSEFTVFSNIDGTIRPVPEPGTLALFGLGLIGIGARALRRKTV